MTLFKKIDKVMAKITGTIGYVSYAAIIIIMLLIVVDVFMRKVVLKGILGSFELVERMLLIMIFASFAYTQTLRGHVHVTLFIAKFPRAVRMGLFGLLGLLSTGTVVFGFVAMIEQSKYSYTAKTVTPVLHIPLYPFFCVAAFCMFIFAVTLFWDAVKCFYGMVYDELMEDMQSSWD